MGERARRIGRIIHGFSILAYLYTGAAVVVYSAVRPDLPLLVVHAVALVAVLVNQLAYLWHQRGAIAQNVFAGVGVLTIIPVFITGGVGGAGVVWSFAYLIFAFTLTGAAMGLVWAAALIGGTALVLATMAARGEPLPHSAPFLIDATWAFLLSVGLLYVFNRAYEESQRRVEEKAEQDREIETLRRTDAIKNAMLSTVSHELKTPLTPLRLQTQILSSPNTGPLNERQRKAISILDRNIGRLAALVEQTLDVSRLNAGRLDLRLEETSIATLALDAAQTFEESARQKGLGLVVERLEDVTARADATRVTQVLHNLLSNAVKFTPEGGRISLRLASEGDVVRVEVTDTGPGIPPEQIAQLFRPFSRLEHEAAARTDGTGLGLYISKGIVEAHGGTIECRSVGPGATFAFTLPRNPSPPGAAGSSG